MLGQLNESDIFVGPRRPWVEQKTKSLEKEFFQGLLQHTSLERSRVSRLLSQLPSSLGSPRSAASLDDLSAELFEEGSVYEMETIGTLSANEFFQTLDLVIEANLAMTQTDPREIILGDDMDVDFSGDIVSIGGPIPNFFTRNVMYGPLLSLPYVFNLNPKNINKNLRDYTPEKLRRVGLSDD